MQDKINVSVIQITVIRIAPKAPNLYPNNPEKKVPIKGKIIINKYILDKKIYFKIYWSASKGIEPFNKRVFISP